MSACNSAEASTATILAMCVYDFVKVAVGCTLAFLVFPTFLWETLSAALPDERAFFVIGMNHDVVPLARARARVDVTGTLVVHESFYFGLNGFLLLAHHKGWLSRYKIVRPKGHEFPEQDLINRTIRKAVVSHFLIQPFTLYFLVFPLISRMGGTAAGQVRLSHVLKSSQRSPASLQRLFKFLFAR
jgi:hypothetical protein